MLFNYLNELIFTSVERKRKIVFVSYEMLIGMYQSLLLPCNHITRISIMTAFMLQIHVHRSLELYEQVNLYVYDNFYEQCFFCH